MWRLKEIYASLHEQVNILESASLTQADLQGIVGADNPLTQNLNEGQDIDDPEVKLLIQKIDTLGLPADTFKIVFVCKPFTRDATPVSPGVGGQNQAVAGRDDIILCSLSSIALSTSLGPFYDGFAKEYGATVAHECGHSLRGIGHVEMGGIFLPSPLPYNSAALSKWQLMADGNTSNHIKLGDPILSGKHWYLGDENIVHNARSNKYSTKIP